MSPFSTLASHPKQPKTPYGWLWSNRVRSPRTPASIDPAHLTYFTPPKDVSCSKAVSSFLGTISCHHSFARKWDLWRPENDARFFFSSFFFPLSISYTLFLSKEAKNVKQREWVFERGHQHKSCVNCCKKRLSKPYSRSRWMTSLKIEETGQ